MKNTVLCPSCNGAKKRIVNIDSSCINSWSRGIKKLVIDCCETGRVPQVQSKLNWRDIAPEETAADVAR